MKVAFSIFILITIAGMALLVFINIEEQEKTYASQPIFICGTPSLDSSEEAKKGRSLFNANCAACHKLDAQSTGPLLRSINERYSAEDIIKFMKNDFSGEIKYSGERGYKCNPFPNLTDADIKNILSYTH
ncbi:hypothetical protein IMCC3317_27340 [Kordia antarctica]|uniref:Cytochrome c domain-containing protein n=1 Tax=Kordia antarctica TaxID=1218801 RepID=A0A7L4ZL89_9FLAO|nr:cytochrome c [Kordia antarctica]QHI37355.1 hypothetical protein IMCC3317_27340 [Kordia antarctica]